VNELKEKVKYASDMGMEFSIITESNCPDGRLQHFYREGSELYRIDEEWRNLLFEDVRADKAEAEVNELKRKLFNEGVKNNSDKARVEFLEGKMEDVEAVIEGVRIFRTVCEHTHLREKLSIAQNEVISEMLDALKALEGRK
jgi:hypothetical protein